MTSTLEPQAVASLRARRAVLMLSHDTPAEPLIREAVLAGALPVAVVHAPETALAAMHETQASLVLADLGMDEAVGRLVIAMPADGQVLGLWSGDAEDDAVLVRALAAGVTGIAALRGPGDELRPVIASVRAGRPAIADSILPAVVQALSGRLRTSLLADPARARDSARARFAAPDALRSVYQPIADLRSRGRLGFLALTRFAGSPEADTALRFAEAREHGLGAELELAAAREALAQSAHLPATDLLFLKLSCATVATGGLDELLADERAARVVLELTGHADLAREDDFYACVDRLRAQGVRFAVDETGAGFGALDHVLDLGPTFVRLAGGLTRGIHTDRTRRALALAVISFASHLGAQVIADRIETEDELNALRRLGVSHGLGFHIGRPGELPAPPAEASAPDCEEAALPAGAVRWALRSGVLPAPPRREFADTLPDVLRKVARRLAPCAIHLAHVDRGASVVRVVEAEASGATALEPGVTFPVDTALEVAVLEARAPQLTAHAACVPLAGPRDAPVAMLTAHVSDPGRLTDDDLGLLRDAAAIVAEALHAEHTEIESALRELSWRDRVTGVLNAARFDALLDETDRRCAAGAGDAYVVHVRLSNYQVLADRMGRALADLVRKDVARALALQADGIDVVARVGDATFGCILHGRRSGEVDYFSQAVADNVAASARRRGATAELRVSAERLGLGDAPGAPKLTARVENPPFAIGASAVGRSLGHDADR